MHNSEAFLFLKENIVAETKNEITEWIEEVISILSDQRVNSRRVLSHNIAIVPRKIKKDCPLTIRVPLSPELRKSYRGWQPEKWTLIEAIRILFNLTVALNQQESERIFIESHKIIELSEKIAYLKGLLLYPRLDYHHAQALEAIRSNTQSVFAAVCLFNPYPTENFEQSEWNNMILKALTWNFSLHSIYGFADRKNETLSVAIHEYIQELKSANRSLPMDILSFFEIGNQS